jgi:hypothetical protein
VKIIAKMVMFGRIFLEDYRRKHYIAIFRQIKSEKNVANIVYFSKNGKKIFCFNTNVHSAFRNNQISASTLHSPKPPD